MPLACSEAMSATAPVHRDTVLCAFTLGAACLLVFGGSIRGFFLADDYTILGSFWGKGGAYLARLLVSDEIGGAWPETFIRPIRPWSLAIDGWIWGLEPFGFHITNVALHAATATAITLLLLQLGAGVSSALPAAMLFLLHPLNVEVATWVAGRFSVETATRNGVRFPRWASSTPS